MCRKNKEICTQMQIFFKTNLKHFYLHEISLYKIDFYLCAFINTSPVILSKTKHTCLIIYFVIEYKTYIRYHKIKSYIY